MHDCPNCQVPLHGHEEVCPSCGSPQYVSKAFYDKYQLPPPPKVNWVPFAVFFIIAGLCIAALLQTSWLGQLLKQGPQQTDPMEKLSFADARNIVEQKITEGLTAVGSTGKLTWSAPEGSSSDKSSPEQVHLTIDTRLRDATSRRSIIDPVKPYMAKAKISILTMKDSKSHATWTYSVQTAAAPSSEENQLDYNSFMKQLEEPKSPPPTATHEPVPQQVEQPRQQPVQQPVQPAVPQPIQQPVQHQPQVQQAPQQAPSQQQEKMPWDRDNPYQSQ